MNFYETVVSQLIPGTVLLFTDEVLAFEPVGRSQRWAT